MKHKILVFLFAILLLFITPVLAADQIFRQETGVDVKVPVRISGATSSTINCNITVLNPNFDLIVNVSQMTNQINYHNFTISQTNTTILGDYIYDVTCLAGDLNSTGSFEFTITPSGKVLSVAQGIIYMFVLIFSLTIFGLILYGAIFIPWKNETNDEGKVVKLNDLKFVKMFLWFFAYVMAIWLTFLAYNITSGFLDFNVASGFLKVLYWILMGFFFPVFVVFLLTVVVNFIEGKKMKEALERGLPFR